MRLAGAVMVAAVVSAACSSGGYGGGGGGAKGGYAAPGFLNVTSTASKVLGGTPQKGGTLKMAAGGDVDTLDPGASYVLNYFSTVGRGTIRTLVTYPGTPDLHKQIKLVPDLATSLGKSSHDNTVWRYTLKQGLTYGPALGGRNVPGVTGKPITSSDIKYAIERLFLPSVGAGYGFYYQDIRGVTAFQKANSEPGRSIQGDISGIETPDAGTIVFHLTKPVGDWDYRMAMPAAGPIPQRYGQKYDSSKSSSYAQHVISTGPYYVSEYSPKTSITLKRNPNWSPSSDEVRKAYVDEIDIREGFDNSVCIQKVLNDEYDTWVTPGCAPIGAQLRKIVTTGDYSDRSFDGPQAATAYVFMNTTLKPFDNLDVRRAVEYAIDKQNLLKLQGGSYVGSIATSVLPPGILGFVSPRDFDPFATPHDRPDLSKAKALMEKAGYGDGYHRPLLVVGDSAQPIPGMLQSVKADLAKIGIDNLKIKTLPFPDWYTNYMQIPSRHVSLGISWWYEDFPSPTSFLTPLLYGPSIHAHGNNNFSLLDDPKLNDLIDKASGETGAAAERTWTKANKVATSLAPWVPYRWFLQPVTVSSRMQNAYYNQYYGTIDWINAGVQGGGS